MVEILLISSGETLVTLNVCKRLKGFTIIALSMNIFVYCVDSIHIYIKVI